MIVIVIFSCSVTQLYIQLQLMGWGLLPEGNEGSQPSVAVASALCKHLATQEEKEEQEKEEEEQELEQEEMEKEVVIHLFDDEMKDLSFVSFFTEHRAILLVFETAPQS